MYKHPAHSFGFGLDIADCITISDVRPEDVVVQQYSPLLQFQNPRIAKAIRSSQKCSLQYSSPYVAPFCRGLSLIQCLQWRFQDPACSPRPVRFDALRPSAETLIWPITAALLVVGSLLPEPNADMLNAVGHGLLSLLPVVAIAALLAGVLTVGRWSDRALAWLKGGPGTGRGNRQPRRRHYTGVRSGYVAADSHTSASGSSPRTRHGILGSPPR